MSRGRRTRKRKRWKGRRDPEAWAGIGKKGAMPEPIVGGQFCEIGSTSDSCGGGHTSVAKLRILFHDRVGSL